MRAPDSRKVLERMRRMAEAADVLRRLAECKVETVVICVAYQMACRSTQASQKQ